MDGDESQANWSEACYHVWFRDIGSVEKKKKKGLVVYGLDKAVKVGDLVWT